MRAPGGRAADSIRRFPLPDHAVSGPVTLEYLLLRGALLGAAAALESARDVGAGLADAREAAIEDAVARRSSAAARRRDESAAQRRAADRITALEASLERLRAVVDSLPATLDSTLVVTVPVPPATPTRADLDRHAAALEAELTRVRDALAGAANTLAAAGTATLAAATLDALVAPASLDALLDAYTAARNEQQATAATASRRAEIGRLLEPLGAAPVLAPELEAVVRELASGTGDVRAEALTLELRRLVALEARRRAAAERDQAEAAQLLEQYDEHEIGDDEVRALVQALELVCAGAIPLDDELAARSSALAARLARDRD